MVTIAQMRQGRHSNQLNVIIYLETVLLMASRLRRKKKHGMILKSVANTTISQLGLRIGCRYRLEQCSILFFCRLEMFSTFACIITIVM